MPTTHKMLIDLEVEKNQLTDDLITKNIEVNDGVKLGELLSNVYGLNNREQLDEYVGFSSGKVTLSENSQTLNIPNLPRKPKKLLLTRYQTVMDSVPTISGITDTIYGIFQCNLERVVLSVPSTYITKGFVFLTNKSVSTTNALLRSVQKNTSLVSYADGTFSIDADIVKYVNDNIQPYFYKGEYEWIAEFDDSEFFEVIDNTLSLKTEYQNGGVLNANLPEILKIPESIEGTTYTTYATGMFENNTRIKHLKLSNIATTLPDNFCKGAKSLIKVDNTDNITKIGASAFELTALQEINFPNLTSKNLGVRAFYESAFLKSVKLKSGGTNIPNFAFFGCDNLRNVTGLSNVKYIGTHVFMKTYSLVGCDLDLSNLKSVGVMAFKECGKYFDWSKASNCTFHKWSVPCFDWSEGATSESLDFYEPWSKVNCAAYINPAPLMLNQNNSAWKDIGFGNTIQRSEPISYNGASNAAYHHGCAIISVYQAYMGIFHPERVWNDITEIEAQIVADKGDIFAKWETFLPDETYGEKYVTIQGVSGLNTACYARFLAEELGLSVETVAHKSLTEEDYQKLYTALSQPNTYVSLYVSSSQYQTQGHIVTAYGIDESGNVLIYDSAPFQSNIGVFCGMKYKLPLQNAITGFDDKYNFNNSTFTETTTEEPYWRSYRIITKP